MLANSHHHSNPSIWPSSKDFDDPIPSGKGVFTAMQWRAKTISSCSRFRRFLIAGTTFLIFSGAMPVPETTSQAHAANYQPKQMDWLSTQHVAISSNVETLELGQTAEITITLQFPGYLVGSKKIYVVGGTLSAIKPVNSNRRTFTTTFTPHPNFKGKGKVHIPNGVFSNSRTGALNIDGFQYNNKVQFDINIDDGPTQQVIGSFMQNRMRLLTSTQPNLTRFLDGSDVALGGNRLSGINLEQTSEGYSFGFKTSLGATINRNAQASLAARMADRHHTSSHAADAIVSTTDAANIDELIEHPLDLPISHYNQYDVWMEIYGAGANSGNNKHKLWATYAGAHLNISENMLVGIMGQFDWADEVNSVTGQTVEGTGWMVGPYMVARLPGQNVFLESRLAWGRSDNRFKQSVSHGGFDTTRLLVSGKLSGIYDSGNDILIRPTIGVNYFRDKQAGFLDNLGNTIAGQTISMGELNFGPTFSQYSMLSNGDMLEASLGTTGVWNFDLNTQGAPAAVTGLGSDSVRARLDLGLERKTLAGRIISLEGFYDGIGTNAYEAYGGKISLSMPIQ